MKKFIYFFAAFFLMNVMPGYTQKLFVGLEGGLINSISINNDQNLARHSSYATYKESRYSRTPSFNIGINVDYSLSKKWGLASKIIFSKEGFNEISAFTTFQTAYTPARYYEYEYITKYSFIRIPLLIQYNFLPENKCMGLSIVAGPNFGFKTHSSIFVHPKNDAAREAFAVYCGTIGENINDFDFALQLGLKAYKHITKNSKIFFEVQGLQSLSDVSHLDLDLRKDNIINRRLASNIGVQIGL